MNISVISPAFQPKEYSQNDPTPALPSQGRENTFPLLQERVRVRSFPQTPRNK